MKRAKVTPRAKLDLFAIWEYIADDSMEAADKVVAKIKSEFGKLAEMPGMGHRRIEVSDERYRFWKVYSYLIVYRIDTSPIQIVRVVSGYRDIGKLFE
ncbi:MAG TPA: type II toxin-antitoxin system RelE/ParE family toxin [Tepidisphaeraceae bacterium]|jgi:antitoxin ParD1/3/4/toxin ParE1/3/4|nr:type II toxin-antitoxin system RelE/ParE family toxin [Tepidisphaeraceae bacterium]